MARDNMLPFSHVWRHVSPKHRSPTYVVLGLGCLSTILLLSALVSERAFNFILGHLVAGGLQRVCPADLRRHRRCTARQDPCSRTRHLRPGPCPAAGCTSSRLVAFTAVAIALVLLPQFAGNGWVFLGIMAVAALWWATGLRARLSAMAATRKAHSTTLK